MRNSEAKRIALGGVMAALALVIMCLGGIIPVATYVCPVLCMMILAVVYRLCGGRIGWAWFGVVAILSALMGPDKEAAAVFVCIGYYPILKPRMDRMKLSILWKALLFNVVILIAYWVMVRIMGFEQIVQDFQGMGRGMLGLLLVLGNITFFLTDVLLTRIYRKK